MRFRWVWFLIFFAWASMYNHGIGQQCTTKRAGNYQKLTYRDVQSKLHARAPQSTFTIRIMAHIIRDNNGVLGPTQEALLEELELMQADFAPHDICFILLEIREIWDSSYLQDADDIAENSYGSSLFQNFGSSDRIDIFVLPEEQEFGGNAYDIPNHYLAFGEQRFGLKTLTHEMGHCLHLFHTHHHYDKYNEGEITNICDIVLERVNGINCQIAGDLCCDTAADNLQNSSASGCFPDSLYTDCNGQNFNLPYENIMGYGLGCRNLFTQDQEDRLHAELIAGPVGQYVRAPNEVTLASGSFSSGLIIRTAGDQVIHPISVPYEISNSAIVKHIAASAVLLRPGFSATPGSSGYYLAEISILCN